MTKFVLLSILLFNVALGSIFTQKWNVKILDENKEEKPLQVIPGKFTKFYFSLTSDEPITKIYPLLGTFKLDGSDIFVTEKDSYDVITLNSLEYEAYIGIPCGTSVSRTTIHTVNFINTNLLSLGRFIFKETNVEIIADKQLTMNLTPLNTELQLNSYSYIRLEEPLYNVDKITVDVSFPEGQQTITIPAFTNSDIDYPQLSSNNGLVAKYYLGNSQNSFTLKLTSSSQCYQPAQNQYTIQVKSDAVADLNEYVQMQMKNSLKIVKSKEARGIDFTMYVPVAPVAVDCQIIPLTKDEDGDDFDRDDNIIAQKQEQTNKLRYLKNFIEKPTTKFNFHFADMSILDVYKVKCVVENTFTNSNKQRFSFGIGLFKGSDVYGLLNPMIGSTTPSQCATLNFDNLQSDLVKKLEDYCEMVMTPSNNGLFGKLKNGCMSCKIVNKELNSVSICAYTEPICPTTYKDDAKERFNTFLKDISSSSKIQENLEIKHEAPTSQVVEIDDRVPDTSKIEVSHVKSNLFDHTFKITNLNDQLIECKYNPYSILSSKLTNEYMLFEKLKLKPNESTEVTYLFTINSDYINVFLNCYYVPESPYHYFKTHAFLAYSHYTKDITVEDYIESKKPNCEKEKSHPYCIMLKTKDYVRKFVSDFPTIVKEIEEKIENFSVLANTAQLTIINDLKTELTKLYEKGTADLQTLFDKTLTMLEYLAQRNCVKINNYELCRKDKEEILSLIINKINNLIISENITEIIKKAQITGKAEDDLKYILLFLNDLTRNPEAFTQKTSETIKAMVKHLVEHFKEIWTSVEPTISETEIKIKIIKTDITNLLIQTVNNLGDILNFEELDEMLEEGAKVIEKTGILVSTKAKEVKQQIEDTVKLLWDYGNGLYESANFRVNLTINVDIDVDLNKNIIASKFLRATSSIEEAIEEVDFEDLGINIKIPINKLLNAFKAQVAQVFVYDKYPLLSAKYDNISPHFISIKLFTLAGKEISVSKMPDLIKSMLPEIRFSHNITENAHSMCFYYDETKQDLSTSGLTTKIKDDGFTKFTVCSMTHFTDFTTGSYNGGLKWWGVLLIIIAVIAVLFGGFVVYQKLRKNSVGVGSMTKLIN